MPSIPILGLGFRRCYKISVISKSFQVTSKREMPLPGVTYVHSYSSYQTQAVSSLPSSHLSATHNLHIPSRTSQYRQDIQSSYLLDHSHYQKKISCITEKSRKILGKKKYMAKATSRTRACLILPIRRGLIKVCSSHASTLSHVYTSTQSPFS